MKDPGGNSEQSSLHCPWFVPGDQHFTRQEFKTAVVNEQMCDPS